MGQAIALRPDFTATELRRLATRTKDVAQARRLLAIAAIVDGASRAAAARIGGMDRQTLRDWVIRFNEHGPDGLINVVSPGAPPKLDDGECQPLAAVFGLGQRLVRRYFDHRQGSRVSIWRIGWSAMRLRTSAR